MISMSAAGALVVGLTLIAVGMLIQYWIGLEHDDRVDAREQDLEAAQAQSLRIAAHANVPSIPVQRDGGAS